MGSGDNNWSALDSRVTGHHNEVSGLHQKMKDKPQES